MRRPLLALAVVFLLGGTAGAYALRTLSGPDTVTVQAIQARAQDIQTQATGLRASPRRTAILNDANTILGLTAGLLATPTTPPPTTTAPTGFVTRSGQALTLNGAPYRFVGFNIWRANVTSWNKPPNTGYLVNDGTTLSDSLTAIGGTQNVIRVWFFQQFALNAGVTDWSAFDKTLSVAQAHGFKVIATLADEWNYEGQPTKDAAWYTSGYKSAVQPYEAVPYRAWVSQVVTHYKDDPNILMWELVNEADVEAGGTCQSGDVTTLSNFVQDVGGLIKSIDPNHLVSLGGGGNGNCGTIDADYQTIMALPQLDICSFHDYYGAANAGAFNTYNGLNVRVTQCAAVNKPLYIGEVGIHLNTAPVSGSLTSRATYLGAKMAAQFAMQGVVGYVPWAWDSRGYSDDYSYSIGDPALAVMDTYCGCL